MRSTDRRRLPSRAVPSLARGLSAFALAAGLLAIACSKTGAPPLRQQTRFLMDTYVTVKAIGPAGRTDRAIAAAFDRMAEIDRDFNFVDSTSPVYRFNYRNEPLAEPEQVALVERALAISRATDGAFDITVQPLVNLWGFYTDHPAIPGAEALDSVRAATGYQYIVADGGRITKIRPDIAIDLGGIAKGYSLQEAARVLRAAGVDSAVIDAGGDVLCLGRKAGENWKIGIRHPRRDGMLGVLAAANLAVVTSGDYERFFEVDGVRYCHILDPRTGYPARGLVSVTVVARDPVEADAWATALFVLGTDGLRQLEAAEGVEAMLVTDSLEVIVSPGLAGALQLSPPDRSE